MEYPEIKIRNKTYKPLSGNYILDNGATTMFCSGDGRILLTEGWSMYRYVVLTNRALKKIDLTELRFEEDKSGERALKKYFYP